MSAFYNKQQNQHIKDNINQHIHVCGGKSVSYSQAEYFPQKMKILIFMEKFLVTASAVLHCK